MNLILRKTYSIALIIVVGFVAYANSLNGEFQFDDHQYIVQNSAIRNASDVKAIYHSRPVPARFIPLYSFAINYHFHKLDVFGYHFINLLIHIFNAILVYWLVNLLFRTPKVKRLSEGERYQYVPLVTALVFLVHPINTQAVSYITQRFTLLATMFYILSVIHYLKFRLEQSVRVRSVVWFVVCVLFALLAMFSKQITITIPIILLLTELYLFDNRLGWSFIKNNYKVITIFILLILIIPGFYYFRADDILTNQLASGSHEGDTIHAINYLRTQLTVIPRYLQLVFIPIGQNLDYDFRVSGRWLEIKTLLGGFFLISLFLWGVVVRKRMPLLSFGVIWLFVTLLVESSIIPIKHVIFEHRMYLPSIGFIMAVVVAITRVSKKRRLSLGVFAIILAMLTVLTVQRNKVWKTEIAMWNDVKKKSPQKQRVYLNLGNAYMKKNDYRLALMHYNKAITLKEENNEAYNLRGLLLYKQGLYSLAIDDFTRAYEINDHNTAALVNRGNVFRKIGRYDLALNDFNLALQQVPEDYRIFLNRGNIFAKLKKYDFALNDYYKVIKLQPQYIDVYKNIGNVYEMQGKYSLALEEYNKVIDYYPQDADSFVFIGTIYARQNKSEFAIDAFSKALKINPQRGDAYYKRSFLHYTQQDFEKALDDIVRAQYLGQPVDPGYINRLKQYGSK